MTAIPQKNALVEKIDAYHEYMQDAPRHHMGASLLGHHCDRYLWLNFRWAVIERFPGRILRLFRRGQLEEGIVIEDLKNAGIDIRFTGDDQKRINFGCHVEGSLDGIIFSGVPEAPNKKHIFECKTHSKKYFDDVQKNGVQKSKFTHYAQMQLYMYGAQVDRALYLAVCKDDDRIYTERVKLDVELAEKLIEKGRMLATDDRMPIPLSTNPTWYQCKMCSMHEFCHETKTTKEVNCRTCARATAKEDSTWHCERWNSEIPKEAQYKGCEDHVLHPDLVPWDWRESEKEHQVKWVINEKEAVNGKDGFSSNEILANPSGCADSDGYLRDNFNARVVG